MQIQFDGQCAMCNSFIIQIEKIYSKTNEEVIATNNSLMFQSERNYILNLDDIKERIKGTIIVCKDKKIFIKSWAIAGILWKSILRTQRIAATIIERVPWWIGDIFYSLIAKRRKMLPVKKPANTIYSNI